MNNSNYAFERIQLSLMLRFRRLVQALLVVACRPGPGQQRQRQENASRRMVRKLKILIHRQPDSFVFHALYWSSLPLLVGPILGITLLWVAMYESVRFILCNAI